MDESIERAFYSLREAAQRLLESERPTFAQPATREQIASLETAAEVPLPPAFRDFLQLADYVEAMEVHNGYWIGGTDNFAHSLRRGEDFPRIVEVHGSPERVVPVGTDGGGSFFMASVDSGVIVRVDHETGEAAIVASDFTDFLRRVTADWHHFADNDRDWPFLT